MKVLQAIYLVVLAGLTLFIERTEDFQTSQGLGAIKVSEADGGHRSRRGVVHQEKVYALSSQTPYKAKPICVKLHASYQVAS